MKQKLLCASILGVMMMAISVNGQNLAVQISDVATRIEVAEMPETSTDWTFETWIYLDQEALDYTGIIDARASEEPGASALVLRLDDTHQFLGYEWGGSWDFADGPDIPLAQWCHVAMVVSSATNMSYMYLNGVEVASDDAYSNLGEEVTLGLVRIGNSNGMDERALIGMMDEIRIWNVARTADEISSNMAKSVEADSPGLLVQYTCDGGIDGDAVLYDATNNYNADITGTVAFVEADIIASSKRIKAETLRLYPSVAENTVTIQGLEVGAKVKIINMSGQVVATHIANSVQLQVPVESLSNGVYLVEATSTNKFANARFIKK